MNQPKRKTAATRAWEEGILMAASVLVSLHDQPGMAADIVSEFGLREADCSRLDSFDKQNLRRIQGLKQGEINLRGLYGRLTAGQLKLLKQREGACGEDHKTFVVLRDLGLVDALNPAFGRVNWFITTAGELVLAQLVELGQSKKGATCE